MKLKVFGNLQTFLVFTNFCCLKRYITVLLECFLIFIKSLENVMLFKYFFIFTSVSNEFQKCMAFCSSILTAKAKSPKNINFSKVH